MTGKKRKKRFLRTFIILAVGIGILAIVLVAADVVKHNSPTINATPRPLLEIDPNAGDLITPTPAPTEPGVSIAGWSRIEIPSGVLEANVSINNPEANVGWYYLTYELRLKETDEVIFSTGLIPPGLYCNNVTLTRTLDPGEYPAILHVQPYRMDEEQTPTNNADLELMLVVK